MKTKMNIAVVALTALAGSAFAGGVGNPGPDVIVGDLNGINYYGTSGGFRAYSVGTTSCNLGTEPADWMDNSVNHPVIAQNIYVINNNRLDHIGMSYLKHSFASLQENLCDSCDGNGGFQSLGTGCSDPYDAGLNGSQGGLGPRYEINATTGQFPWPFAQRNQSGGTTFKRAQVPGFLMPSDAPAGTQYMVEGQYVTLDDTQAGNNSNNVSYRMVNYNEGTFRFSFAGSTVREQPAIQGWATFDSDVVFNTILADGQINGAVKVVDNGNDTWTYNYVFHNEYSDRGVSSILVPMDGAEATGFGFNAPLRHSGEEAEQNNLPWSMTVNANDVTFAANGGPLDPTTNRISWSTAYSFSFTAPTPPMTGRVTLGMFKSGGPATYDMVLPVPSANVVPCPADFAAPFGFLDFNDVVAFLGAFSSGDLAADFAAPFGFLDFNDVVGFLGAFAAGCP